MENQIKKREKLEKNIKFFGSSKPYAGFEGLQSFQSKLYVQS
jgi:hypothetical protein